MIAILVSLFTGVGDLFRRRSDLEAELFALRHQLLVLRRQHGKRGVRLHPADRVYWVVLSLKIIWKASVHKLYGSVCRDRADNEWRGGATMTAFYGGIDLHSNNSVVVVMDDSGKVVYRRRLVNDLPRIDEALAPYREGLSGVVVESTTGTGWSMD